MNRARFDHYVILRQAGIGRCLKVISALTAGLCFSGLGGCGWMSTGENSEGVRLFQMGNYDGAASDFREAMQNDPNNPDSYYNLAAYYHRQGKLQQKPADTAQAESYYRQCLDHNPNHVECRRGLAVLLVEQGRSEEAFKMLEDWSTENPSQAAPKIELARMYEEFGDKKSATDCLTSALAVSPNDPRALAALGRLREESGDVNQAMANYQRALMVDRNQPELAQRVNALQQAGVTGAPYTSAGGTRLVAAPDATYR
ncbi:MAG TPA: tetratricopeptide repeat protein [Pirellulales bacterium]|nr:tetratricopeptide repeat protein [Pirellulales bacterium]